MVTNYYKRTKIVATLGPAITQKIWDFKMLNDKKNIALRKKAYETMEEIFKSGVNCVRLNFSHGSYDEQLVRIKIAREVAKKLGINISIMLDTKGPEIRVGKMKTEFVEIEKDSQVKIYTKKAIVGTNKQFFVTDSTGTYNMANDVNVGGIILIDDGKLQLKVISNDKAAGIITTKALNKHVISEKRRINLPNTEYTIPFLSEKDRNDIKFAIENDLDYIAASFVNNKKNIQEIREILKKHNNNKIQIISKIESTHAIKNIDEIIAESDGIMVARGDLALEIPYYDVPYWEKYIIKKCRFVAKPVIVATQMLDSLEKNIQPTRAEVTDVFFAVERGTDATMLSGESAKGQFPVIAVSTMRKIDIKSEILFDYKRAYSYYFSRVKLPLSARKIAKKIASKTMPSGSEIIPNFPYEFVALFTNDESVIRAVSNIRPAATILVFTDQESLIRKFGINYAIQTKLVNSLKEAKSNYRKLVKDFATHLYPKAKNIIAYIDNSFKKV